MNEPYRLLLDVWEGHPNLDEELLLANDVGGLIIRLNDMNGGHHLDTNFAAQWKQAERFVRALYFVYNPWVTGAKNFEWLLANCPAGVRALFIDIEVKKPFYSPSTYALEVERFIELAKKKWTPIIYTGEWFLRFLAYWPKSVEYWWAQYPLKFYPPQPVTLTWETLREQLLDFSFPYNSGKIPSQIRVWQFTGDRLILPGDLKPIDVNMFYGTQADLELRFGPPVIPSNPLPPPGEPPMTDDMKYLADKLFAGLELIAKSIAQMPLPPTGDPTTPPAPPSAPVKPRRNITLILESDSNPTLTAGYATPDVNDISKHLIFNGGANTRQPIVEECPSATQKGMPAIFLEPLAYEAEVRKLFKDWAWLPRQILNTAGGIPYSMPTVAVGGKDMTTLAGVWVERIPGILTPPASLTQSWVDSIVAYLKATK